jgi:hypothetical protein
MCLLRSSFVELSGEVRIGARNFVTNCSVGGVECIFNNNPFIAGELLIILSDHNGDRRGKSAYSDPRNCGEY